MIAIITKPWLFVSDTNGDSIITISDVVNWIIWLFFLPGDTFLYCIITIFPNIARFFEVSNDNFHGFLSGFLSFFAWCCIFSILAVIESIGKQKKVRGESSSGAYLAKKIIAEDQKLWEEDWNKEKKHRD